MAYRIELAAETDFEGWRAAAKARRHPRAANRGRMGRRRTHWASKMADGSSFLATVHPSYLLRLPENAARARAYEGFVGDLRVAASFLASGAAPSAVAVAT